MASDTARRTIILLRHAKAEQAPGTPDAARQLTARGRRDATAAGSWLAERIRLGAVPPVDVVVCSTSTRTRQTWAEASVAGLTADEVRDEPSVYNAPLSVLLELVQGLDDTLHCVLLVGHAPGVPDLAGVLVEEVGASTGRAEPALAGLRDGFGTAGLAVLQVGGSWADVGPGTARLAAFVTPRG